MTRDEEHVHSGIATFMRAPHIDIRDASHYDVVVLGVPVDYGVSFRSGQRFGPRAIRESSFWHRLDGSAFVDLSTGATVRSGALSVADLGDLALWPADPGATTSASQRWSAR